MADDNRPYDQQDRAADAQLNPNDPATHASSPAYGDFGHAEDPNSPTAQQPGRSGANDNPDEFSEFDDREEEAQKAPDTPQEQFGHISQNQDTEVVREAEADGADNEELRAAWAKDDPRYAGGGTHNTREESANSPATDE